MPPDRRPPGPVARDEKESGPIMKSRLTTVVVIASFLAAAPIVAHAQLRGLLKKKADEIIKGKPAPSEPAAAPDAPTPAEPAKPGAPPAPAARAEAKAPADPLDLSELNLQSKANQVLRGELRVRPSGDWEQLPYISSKTVAAARALDEPARIAFVENVGAAFKTLVTSDAFATAHAAYIKAQYGAVDHGIAGLANPDELQRKGDFAAYGAIMQRQSAVAVVDLMDRMPPDQIQASIAEELKDWSRYADDAKRRDRAKYQRMVKDAQALQALGTSDPEKLRRGFAVLRSIDQDGPATEEALYALHTRVVQEKEQVAFDEHNLKAVLRKQLTAFAALVPTVDFDAATTQKGSKLVFVKPAYETKGAVWKACFRAGKGASTAALRVAQSWLKEL